MMIEAFELYGQKFKDFGGYRSHKNNLFWRKIVGFIQRYFPACYAQAFTYLFHIVCQGRELRRSLKYNALFPDKVDQHFPLDSNMGSRLGYDYAMWDGSGKTTEGGVWADTIVPYFKSYADEKGECCTIFCSVQRNIRLTLTPS